MSRNRLIAVAAALVLVLAGCGGEAGAPQVSNGGEPESGGLAVYCTLSRPNVLNPFVSGQRSTADLRVLLYTPLVLYDSTGGFRPHLARSWEWSDDYRTLVLNLRDDIRWHDGRPVTAEDVAWTLTIAADSAYPYVLRADLGEMEQVTARDNAVQVRFRRPAPAGLEPFTRLPILPRHILDTIPPAAFQRAPYHQEPIGSGPFRFAGRLPDGSIRLDRVADFPEELGRPLLDRIVLREVPEASAILVELSTGSADLCTMGSSVAGDAAAAGNDVLPIVPVGAIAVAVDNRKPPFSDRRVRRALSAALNRADIAAAVSPAASPARNFLPDVSRRWRDSTALQPDNDLALAAALLDSAGWHVGPDGMRRNEAGERLRFTIVAPPALQNPLTVVQAQLRRVGVDAQLQMMEPSTFVGLLGNPDRRPAALAIVPVPDRIAVPDPYADFHSSSEWNLSSYRQSRVDAILEQLQVVTREDERAGLYRELQRYVADDVPLIYTIQAPQVLAVRPRIRDVRVDANGPFTNVADWWIPASERRR